tara:strand:- start:1421 stop:1771 length:351 start_codon:yes stop_codon:yes gene_type:complete
MGRLDKIKRELMEESNKRLLNEEEEQSFDQNSYEDKLEMISHEVVMLYTKMEEEKGKEFADNEMKWFLDGVLAGTINSEEMNSDEGWGGHFTKENMGGRDKMDKHLRDKDGGMGSL